MQFSESFDIRYLMAYDVKQKKAERLMTTGFTGDVDALTGSYSWRADMEQVIVSEGHPNSTASLVFVYNLEGTRTEGWDSLPTNFLTKYGVVHSPDGEWLALAAAPELSLVQMFRVITGTAAESYTLYVMRPDASVKRGLFEGLRSASPPAWSPDGEWLALPATTRGLFGAEGLWLVRGTSGERRLLAYGSFERVTWSPDGRFLAALQRTGDEYSPPSKLVVIEARR